MTTLEVGIIATLCAFWLGVFLTLVRFFENKVMTGFVKVYVDVFRALPTIVLVSLIHYGAPFIGIYLPLITTNCAVLGAATISANNGYTVMESTVFGFFSGVGFALALLLFASLRERLELATPPEAFKGTPIALVTAGILAMAFMGFSGLV